MAAGDSSTSICNIALIALGEDPITSLADNTKRAILCSARYQDVRRAVLRSHPWNCNRKQAQWASDATGPLFTFAYRYQLPGDFMRMYSMPENDMALWDIMDGYLYTDQGSPLDVVYGYDLQDETKFDPLLTHAIAYSLAGELAIPLTQNTERAKQALAVMEGKLGIARLIGSQENSPREWDEDILLRSRR